MSSAMPLGSGMSNNGQTGMSMPPDRNEYVTIIWDNIISEARSNFMKYPHGEIDSFNVEYGNLD